MEKDLIEKIMKNYKEVLSKIENSDKEFEFNVNRIKLHIERLEQEQREYTDGTGELYNEYEKKIKESEKELYDLQNSKSEDKIEKEKQIEQAKNDLKDKALKDLTMNKTKLEKAIENKDFERRSILHEISNFVIEYDDERNPINGGEQRVLYDNLHKVQDELNELNECIALSDKYINELKAPTKEIKEINEVIKAGHKDTQKTAEPAQTTPAQTTPAQAAPAQATPAQAAPAQATPAQAAPAQAAPAQATPAQAAPAQAAPAQATPAQAAPAQTAPAQTAPAQATRTASGPIIPEPIKTASKPKAEELSEEDKIAMAEMKKTADLEKEMINQFHIDSYTAGEGPTINYIKGDKKISRSAIYKFDNKMDEIKKILKEIKPEIDFESEEGKKELKKYEKTDLNIVYALKNNSNRLKEYLGLINGNIEQDTEDENALKIFYDIRGLRKAKISKEEKKELENVAYEHRDIATVKATLFQNIKFAFRSFRERHTRANQVKLLTEGNQREVIKNGKLDENAREKTNEYGIEAETKEAIAKGIEEKHAKTNTFKEEIKVPLEISEKLKNGSSDAKELNFQDKYDLDK